MKLTNKNAEWFVPDGSSVDTALKRTTHLAVSAHQDDIEIMAYDGVLKCFGSNEKWFSAVVVTNGAGSARNGIYTEYTDEDMQKVRKTEQKKAAYVGEYSALALLDYTSSRVKAPDGRDIIDELKGIIMEARPEVVYTHNLADKHDTHLGVVTKLIKAIRELPAEMRPKELYGCEVWRNLDWVMDSEKVVFDVSGHPALSAALLGVFDSQIAGGKRYDLATAGRRIANATYAASHSVDNSDALSYAIDLTPLIQDEGLSIVDYIKGYIARFEEDVTQKLEKLI
ncbi:MAG TPA: PIG-L family deacetylase [Ruminiclostridium sp.]|nr:PIG-L family deacetylase [Ruminiclostridium sp.]